jgi:hypothetical protein
VSGLLSWLIDGAFLSLSFSPFPEFEVPPSSHLLGPSPMPIMYNQCENFEPQEVRIIKLLRIVHLRRWKIAFLSIFRVIC